MKPRSPISRVSKRRSQEVKRHPAIRKAFLDTHTICFRCGHYVARRQRTTHHYFGRVGALLNYVPGFRMADFECHRYIENHRKESIAKGWRADERIWNRPSLIIDKRNPVVHTA